MTVCWRLVKASLAAQAFSGEGARVYGGRWNQRGASVVYAAGSLALAALELSVHLPRGSALRLSAFRVEIPDGVAVESVAVKHLSSDWRDEPPPESTKDFGTRWAAARTSVALQVPSVLVPAEWNIVLSPGHAKWSQIRISPPEPFSFDPRMWK